MKGKRYDLRKFCSMGGILSNFVIVEADVDEFKSFACDCGYLLIDFDLKRSILRLNRINETTSRKNNSPGI